ncbi:hypothetical protein [Stenotrophomonas sp. PS02289]|uniref:hypothetical protein n=1 Tax=Stenotrophomonas sp. PS02289 TaxID=2991422 RepID=UPI00249C1F14|nr:hypothetical protein [Stenotrophomonas sp. PS02289]
MTQWVPKNLVTLQAVRGANTRIMDRGSEAGRNCAPGKGAGVKVILLTSDQIAKAGKVAFSSLKRR